MAAVGPVVIGEVRKVLTERLRTLAVEPPRRRFGRIFVGAPSQARGRTFRVVFIPGLAERIFPQKLREDPLLLDDVRAALGVGLPVREDRSRERAPAAAAGDRRRDRAAVPVVPATGRQRVAPARAVVLRARREARADRPDSVARGSAARRLRPRRGHAGLAGAGGTDARDRRARARPRHSAAALRRARSREGGRAGALPAGAESLPGPFGARALGADITSSGPMPTASPR